MATIQGDFPNAEMAERAKLALRHAGIEFNRIRTWNILTSSGSSHDGGAVTTGAVVGGLLAGGGGIVAGAGLGAILEGGDDDEETPPSHPSGVCVVVDIHADQQQLEALLLSSGATNVHLGPAAR